MEQRDSVVAENRIEDKYIIDKKHYDQFIKLFETFMEPYTYVGGTSFTLNKSIYFDSANLDCVKAHLNDDPERHKIRIRCYAPDGKWSNVRFIEIKRKDKSRTIKDRLQIGPVAFKSLLEKSEIPVDDELLVLNDDDLGEGETIVLAKTINGILKINGYRPVIEIVYKRIAYQDPEDPDLRVTIDQDLKVKPLPDLEPSALSNPDYQKDLGKIDAKYLNDDDFIMEIKYTEKIPKWLKKKFKKHFLEPESFSKYCWSIARTLGNELKIGGK